MCKGILFAHNDCITSAELVKMPVSGFDLEENNIIFIYFFMIQTKY